MTSPVTGRDLASAAFDDTEIFFFTQLSLGFVGNLMPKYASMLVVLN